MNTNRYRLLLDELSEVYKRYTHVANKLESYWGTQRCHAYFCKLLSKDRERMGFPLETYTLISNLYLLHRQEYGDFGYPLILFDPNVEKIGV